MLVKPLYFDKHCRKLAENKSNMGFHSWLSESLWITGVIEQWTPWDYSLDGISKPPKCFGAYFFVKIWRCDSILFSLLEREGSSGKSSASEAPYHLQGVEKRIKIMTKASGKIVGNDIRDRYVRAVLNLNYCWN